MLVTAERCLHCFMACSVPHPALPATGWGCTRSWEGTQLEQWTTTDQRDTPGHVASSSAIKAGGIRKAWHSGWWCLSSWVTVMHDGALLSWEWLNTACPLEALNEFLILPCLHMQLLLSLLNILYLNLWVFMLLPFDSLPIPLGGCEWAAAWGWAARQGKSTTYLNM